MRTRVIIKFINEILSFCWYIILNKIILMQENSSINPQCSSNFYIAHLPLILPQNYTIFSFQPFQSWDHSNRLQMAAEPLITPTIPQTIVKQEYNSQLSANQLVRHSDLQQNNSQNAKKSFKKSKTEIAKDFAKVEPVTEYKAKYFDVSQSPLLTSKKYFMVEKDCVKKNKRKQVKGSSKSFNQLDEEQSDSLPFIIFKDRRLRKKYRRYFKNEVGLSFLDQDAHSSPESGENIQAKALSKEEPSLVFEKVQVASEQKKQVRP